jgi:U32 family peptidase
MDFGNQQVELLAPVGRWAGLEPVLASGADAVYLGGKEYNMRRHRPDFNFGRDEIVRAAQLVHAAGKKLYITVNSLLSSSELQQMGDYLEFLQSAEADALIVQDLGLIELVRSLGLSIPLHASTMMNIHSGRGAQACAGLGISRIVCSRDITLAQVAEMRSESGLEMEFFVHGDMCIAQSGQCYASGILFGNSSNRGRCMKPCRWAYDVVDLQTNQPVETAVEGRHVLAVKDICLIQHLPELVSAGVASCKIEGRMRSPDFISRVVKMYRMALDAYRADPLGYQNNHGLFDELHRFRVREFSTCFSFGQPGSSFIGSSGAREPLFLSTGARELPLDLEDAVQKTFAEKKLGAREAQKQHPVLSVRVGSLQAAEAALEGGADWLYAGGETMRAGGQPWGAAELAEVISLARSAGKKFALETPRVTLARQLDDLGRFLKKAGTLLPDAIAVHNLGSLRLVTQCTDIPVFAGFSFNCLNTNALQLLRQLGVSRVTLSCEASLDEAKKIARESPLPLECIVHGPVTGMYAEHCLMALLLMKTSSRDPCREPCRFMRLGLKNSMGDIYPVELDQFCRSHVLLARDTAGLPVLADLIEAGVHSLRIEAQHYDPCFTGLATKIYARFAGLDSLDQDSMALLRAFIEESPRGFSCGAYDKGIFQEASRLRHKQQPGKP